MSVMKSSHELNDYINYYLHKIEKNGNSKDLNLDKAIEKLGNVAIPAQEIIDKKLVNYMKGVALRFPRVRREADALAKRWQQQADFWLKENNLPEKRFLEQLDRNMRPVQQASPQLNGSWNAHRRSSGSDEIQNYPSSSSQEVESPDSPRANERSTSSNHRSNHHNSFVRNYSPLQFENPSLRNLSPAEYNANLSIDPREVTPINKVQGLPAKGFDRFSIPMKENMFRAVKRREPITEAVLSRMSFLCNDMLKLPSHKQPDYIKGYRECPNQESGDLKRYQKGKTEKNKNSRPSPHNSHNMPSTPQGARESPKRSLESKEEKPHGKPSVMETPSKHLVQEKFQPWNGSKSHMGSSESSAKSKDLKDERPCPQDIKDHLAHRAIEQSKSGSASKHDKKKKHVESSQSVVTSKEVKQEKPHTQDSKNLPSTSQSGGADSSKTCHVSKHDRKRKHAESGQTIDRTKESNEEQRFSQDNKLKHISKTDRVKESKELQPLQSRTLKSKEVAQSVAKAYEFKDEHQSTPNRKLKLDPKRVMEGINGDKNHIKKRDSSDQSAMVAITSSKKDRTSVYHGGRKCSNNPLRLHDLCTRTLIKVTKQTSDPLKYFINRGADYKTLEPILVLIGPEKLQKLEDEMEFLKDDTDLVWQLYCDRRFKPKVHLKRPDEKWRSFFERCHMECEERFRNVTASVHASASKAKPERQIKLTTVDGPPTKRSKTDHAVIAKSNPNNLAIKQTSNSCQPSSSRSDVPVPPKGVPNHIKSSHKTIKKDAPLMHKAKKNMAQLHRIHRN